MVSHLYSMGLCGMDAFAVEVEADISNGMPGFDTVGLPDAAVKEARDRVRAALKNSGFRFPVSRITVNLAPADKRKEGTLYDLPLLLSLLCATEQLLSLPPSSAFLGELSLTGEVRPVRGVLPMAIRARELGFRELYVPTGNAAEAAAAVGLQVYPVRDVASLILHLRGAELLTPAVPAPPSLNTAPMPDFCEVRGQEMAKRALEIAAAGMHNVLLIGPPGSGKSMLAKRLPSILPVMTETESMETTKIHSVAGILPADGALVTLRPFRSPHHTVSPAGLSGGGAVPRPGELSLAHNGVLFLDELPEFTRNTMEVLRQPMEDGTVTISRVSGSIRYPCAVMLIAAMNPCPCGYFGHPTRPCTCGGSAVSRYLSRVSGPLLDRFDLHVDVPPVEFSALSSDKTAEESACIRARVNAAREIQTERYKGSAVLSNARITPDLLHEVCRLSGGAQNLLKAAFERMGLSARAYDRVLKVSRTIADLSGSRDIEAAHAAEAVQYRSLDRKYWSGGGRE